MKYLISSQTIGQLWYYGGDFDTFDLKIRPRELLFTEAATCRVIYNAKLYLNIESALILRVITAR